MVMNRSIWLSDIDNERNTCRKQQLSGIFVGLFSYFCEAIFAFSSWPVYIFVAQSLCVLFLTLKRQFEEVAWKRADLCKTNSIEDVNVFGYWILIFFAFLKLFIECAIKDFRRNNTQKNQYGYRKRLSVLTVTGDIICIHLFTSFIIYQKQ